MSMSTSSNIVYALKELKRYGSLVNFVIGQVKNAFFASIKA